MGKIGLVLVVAFVLCVGAAHAEEWDGDIFREFRIENGELMDTLVFSKSTGMKVTDAAKEHPKEVEEAYVTGDMVTVQTKEVPVVTDLFHYRTDTVRSLGVKCYPGNLIDTWNDGEVQKIGEPKFFWFPVFWLVAVAVFARALKTGNYRWVALATIGTVLSPLGVPIGGEILSAIGIVAFICAISIDANNNGKKTVMALSGILSVCLAGMAWVVYWPLISSLF